MEVFQIDQIDYLGHSLKVLPVESEKRRFDIRFRLETDGVWWSGIDLTPEQARKLADRLLKMADECEKATEELEKDQR